MLGLIDVPIAAITSLTAETAVTVIRGTLRSECRYSGLSPTALTVSGRLTIADGGIDANVNTTSGLSVPTDCLFQAGLTGFQIKSGTSFKPWTASSIRSELLDSKGELYSEVQRLAERGGRYALICTGHDLTPRQRNEATDQIALVLKNAGFPGYDALIDVFGASQLAEYIERYPGLAALVTTDPIQEALVFDEWVRDDHMSNSFEVFKDQSDLIDQIRQALFGSAKHVRVLGEPGLGKTRLVLEALRDENLAPIVLYIEHGSMFGSTRLFRQLLKSPYNKPLILVLDELPEQEMAEIWRHLKARCGALKIVSLDHGTDETQDTDIQRIFAPLLTAETIKKILINRLGDSRELDRWVEICEGSPRVAQAVADNLRANPADLLRPPATVPIWDRFLHGYGKRDEQHARQIDCVTQYLALFNRFGFDDPVGDEARYIADLVAMVDPTIGWARFQEIVQSLRARRVLQGTRTLFFVPKALHIYLWQRFWANYGRGFDFTDTFNNMPESLHAWFMNMFKYAGDAATAHVIEDILKPNGIYSNGATLTSAKGARFLSTLTEANPVAVLRLLEATLGSWSDEEISSFRANRQTLVWTLEKIAVWPQQCVRGIRLLIRLAVNETDTNSNNATGTLRGFFCIGPEAAATEASPVERLPALLPLLRSSTDKERELGLSCMEAALATHGRGYRIVGPEYQGLKPRAKLWIPKTYGDWWDAQHLYFKTLINETVNWPDHLRSTACSALLSAIQQQIKVKPCTQLAFDVLGALVLDPNMNSSELNKFFADWSEYHDQPEIKDITDRIVSIGRSYTKQSLTNRFQRYVVDVDWLTWDEDKRERRGKRKNHAKPLVNGLAKRVATGTELFDLILPFLSPGKESPALWHFGDRLASNDPKRSLRDKLIAQALSSRHWGCLGGYLSFVQKHDVPAFRKTVTSLLSSADTAWLGAALTVHGEYDEILFDGCLVAFGEKWIETSQFSALRYGRMSEKIPSSTLKRLIQLLNDEMDAASVGLLIGLFHDLPFTVNSPFDSATVFSALRRAIPSEEGWNGSRGYDWQNACKKLIEIDNHFAIPLLDALLTEMGHHYRFSYDHYVESVTLDLVKADPIGAWQLIARHFEATLPKWRSDLVSWLKGGLASFHEKADSAPINLLPVDSIISWIDIDPVGRAGLIGHCVPGTLDLEVGGKLSTALIAKYPAIDGVKNGISAAFHSGGWTGPTSLHLKRKREKLRDWLTRGFEFEVTQWIESELEYIDKKIEREEIAEERTRFD
jgi:hypothetical protein